jgi:hypothetical protein
VWRRGFGSASIRVVPAALLPASVSSRIGARSATKSAKREHQSRRPWTPTVTATAKLPLTAIVRIRMALDLHELMVALDLREVVLLGDSGGVH